MDNFHLALSNQSRLLLGNPTYCSLSTRPVNNMRPLGLGSAKASASSSFDELKASVKVYETEILHGATSYGVDGQ